jgi:REP element-mobilizing transposase RayT
MIFRNRGYLPHIESQEGIYFVTFRLADSLPLSILAAWESERKEIVLHARNQKRELSEYELRRLGYLYLEKVEMYLDSGMGECWLSNPQVARLVSSALKYFDGTRYNLHCWCIMPNHVHVLFGPLRWRNESRSDSLLIPILHSWKSFTASKANQILNRKGKFWQEEYYDTLVKSESQFAFYVRYILENPVSAKLCQKWQDWAWSGCSQDIMDLLKEEPGGLEARAPSRTP